ncbi:MAG: hypothetical protein B7Z66_14935 [Chromatiales bacterium 21-64-14]|nr:MAG: hypothetical protein B7Z66_14935 [Chromatiales bacterium 21-64-14]
MLSKTGLFIAFCALNALDYALTRRILAAGGFEANRLLRWAYRRAGPAGIALVKAAGVVVLAVLWMFHQLPTAALAIADAIYLGVIAIGFLQIHPLRR